VERETGEQWIKDFEAARAAEWLLDRARRWLLIRGQPRRQLDSLVEVQIHVRIGGYV
jgi:hypothetical protein